MRLIAPPQGAQLALRHLIKILEEDRRNIMPRRDEDVWVLRGIQMAIDRADEMVRGYKNQ